MGSIMSTIASIKYVLLSSSVSPPAYIAIILMLGSILAAAKAGWKAVLSKRSTVAPQLSDQCYIARLPEDVLLEIFIIATRFDAAVYGSKSAPPPVRLAATCRYWRAIMLSYGAPWSVFNLNKGRYTAHFHERSRGALLEVYWSAHRPSIDAFISQNLHRIVVLQGFVQTDESLRTPSWLYNGDGRALQSVNLFDEEDRFERKKVHLFSQGAPQKLHALQLIGISPQFANSGLGGLTVLQIECRSDENSTEEFRGLLDLLRASPSLKLLKLAKVSGWIPPLCLESPPTQSIPLLHLNSIHLSGPLPSTEILLKLIRLPDTAKCHIYVSYPYRAPSLNPLDLLGPAYLPAGYFTALDELAINPWRSDNYVEIRDSQFVYTRTPSKRQSLDINVRTTEATRDLIAIMMKYPISGVTTLGVNLTQDCRGSVKQFDFVPILQYLPALTSIEYSVEYSRTLGLLYTCDPVRNSSTLPLQLSSMSSAGKGTELPVIRKFVFRVLQLPWRPQWPSDPLRFQRAWCAEVLEPLAIFLKRFPALELLKLVSYHPDDGPATQVWAKTELERLGLDPQVSVRVESLELPPSEGQ